MLYLIRLLRFTACVVLSALSLPALAANSAPAFTPLEALGEKLFFDASLSEPRGMSCATCHDPAKAFQGNNHSSIAALAKGSREDQFGTRNVPTLLYALFSPPFHFVKEKNEKGEIAYNPVGGQFLDGRAATLAKQIEGPLLSPREMNNASKEQVVQKVREGVNANEFKKLFGAGIFADDTKAFAAIGTALQAYEKSAVFRPFSSKFDAVLAGKETFTPLEAEGFKLFKDTEKGNCLACHVGDEKSKRPHDWLFTDFSYDAFGAPRNAAIPDNNNPEYVDLGLCDRDDFKTHPPKGVDLKTLCGAFKVPTLRNIAVTGPYMHNGVFKTLRDVVAFYATRDTDPARWYPKNREGGVQKFDDVPEAYRANINTEEAPYDRKAGEMPRLNDAEIDALVAFLSTLTDKPFQKTGD